MNLDKRKLLVCYVINHWLYLFNCCVYELKRYISYNLIVIMLCDWWKFYEYVRCERVVAFKSKLKPD